MQVDLDLLVRTDEESRIEWGVMINSDVLRNCTIAEPCPVGRSDFDAVIDTGKVSFSTAAEKANYCWENPPADPDVRPVLLKRCM